MQALARALPWRDVIGAGATFLPCAIALCSELRKGEASIFGPYFEVLPAAYSNAIAPCDDDASGGDEPWDKLSPGALASAPLEASGRRAESQRWVMGFRDATGVWTSSRVCSARSRQRAGHAWVSARLDAFRVTLLPERDAARSHAARRLTRAEVVATEVRLGARARRRRA